MPKIVHNYSYRIIQHVLIKMKLQMLSLSSILESKERVCLAVTRDSSEEHLQLCPSSRKELLAKIVNDK